MISLEELKVAVSLMLLSPFIPLLFMGEEYAEPAPFNYFVSFSDPGLIEAVRKGRAEEFGYFNWTETVDPQAEETFQASKLQHGLRHEGQHGIVYGFYRELLRLRRELPALANLSLKDTSATVWEEEKLALVLRRADEQTACLVCSLNEQETVLPLPLPAGSWRQQLDTAAARWLGSGQEAPETVDSNGEVRLSINPKSCTLWVQTVS
jgi:maltooligosyltrehalose trehalohydrolase